jgi:transposase
MTCGPGSPGTRLSPWSPPWRRCGPVPAAPSATPPASRCGSWAGARSSPGGQIERLDELIIPLVTARAPGLLALYGVGPDTAALLLIAAGDHPERLRSEAAWAHLRAAAPIPASSGKVTRRRLNPGGNREANHALWRIVITRMGSHPPTRVYVERRTAEGLSKKEIIRCLKRYVAREVYRHLRPAD